jgi:hypothetical protein
MALEDTHTANSIADTAHREDGYQNTLPLQSDIHCTAQHSVFAESPPAWCHSWGRQTNPFLRIQGDSNIPARDGNNSCKSPDVHHILPTPSASGEGCVGRPCELDKSDNLSAIAWQSSQEARAHLEMLLTWYRDASICRPSLPLVQFFHFALRARRGG